MTHHLRSAVVLGAGTMGAQIAAHLANAGIPSLLLDVTADAAAAGLARARALKPDPFMVPEAAALIRTGSLDDLAPLAAADWIIEAIVEDLAIKQALLARVDAVRAPDAVVSSNTSGIPLAAIAEGRSEGFRRHWIGTHFFNPPRYLRLVELITTADTSPDVAARVQHWLDQLLGKVMSPGSQITSNSTRRCVSSAESSHVSLRQLTGFLTYELLARHIAGRT